MTIPRSLHVVSLSLMALMLAAIGYLVVGFAMAGPADNLAGVLLIFAAAFAIPLVIALALWGTGFRLRNRAPRVALGLVVSSVVVGVLGVAGRGLWLIGLGIQLLPAG